MQVVPSQRMSIEFKAAPIDLYRALRCFNPTPYMYFFNFGDFHVVGSSPEVLVRVEDGLVTVRPIAGTRRAGSTKRPTWHWSRICCRTPRRSPST